MLREYLKEPSVFVCICNGLRERDVREASQGVRSVKELYCRLGVDVQCGQCTRFAKEIMNETRNGPSPDTAIVGAVA